MHGFTAAQGFADTMMQRCMGAEMQHDGIYAYPDAGVKQTRKGCRNKKDTILRQKEARCQGDVCTFSS